MKHNFNYINYIINDCDRIMADLNYWKRELKISMHSSKEDTYESSIIHNIVELSKILDRKAIAINCIFRQINDRKECIENGWRRYFPCYVIELIKINEILEKYKTYINI